MTEFDDQRVTALSKPSPSPESVVREQVASDHVTPAPVTPFQVSSEQVASEQAASGESASGNAPGNASPRAGSDAATGEVEGAVEEPASSAAPEAWDASVDVEVADDDPELLELIAAAKTNKRSDKICLTEEEMALPASARAALLQQRIKERRVEYERQERLTAEKRRIESQKKMMETQRVLEEKEKERFRAELEREKRELREEEERQRRLLALEFKERFGYLPSEEAMEAARLKRKPVREQIRYWLGKLNDRPEAATKTLPTLFKIMHNARTNPTNPKFLKISKTNKVFSEKVGSVPEATALLEIVGFKATDTDWLIEGYPNGFLLSEVENLIQYLLKANAQKTVPTPSTTGA
ncbi:PUB domain protein [Gregarina niphandrodes]|uniref:PUB domain protein n=1 Tax=Gregarina niphandrodes TaxID=110365 RepID=A0A023B5R3_GRENI|nr:PUB domain protein [Gregarina niphandrodes]EZG61409.1 PUB domain protein [Gregarina niphandrodes]|eukprot:XP_011130769.1 PUB domain protein [Gregarina niphandrodes]